MTKGPEIVHASEMSECVDEIYQRITEACDGALVSDACQALLREYSRALLVGSADYEMHTRNIKLAYEVLDANARMYFKVNN